MSESLAETPAAEEVAVDETPVAEVEPGTVDETAVEEPAAEVETPALSWDSPELQARLAEVADQRLYNTLAELAAQGEPVDELGPPPDPWESDNYAEDMQAWLDARDARLVESLNAQLAEREQTQVIDGQVSNLLTTTAEEFKIAEGDRGYFEWLANSLAENATGTGPEVAKQVARAAAQQMVERDKRLREEGKRAYLESIGQIAETRAEPGVGGGAVEGYSTPSSYRESTDRWLERQRAGRS